MEPEEPSPVALDLNELPTAAPRYEIAPLGADVSDLVTHSQHTEDAALRRRYLRAARGVEDLARTVAQALEVPDQALHEVRVPSSGEYAFALTEFLLALGVLQDLPSLRQERRWTDRPPITIQPVRAPTTATPKTAKRRRKK